MKDSVVLRMRREAKRALLAYRRNKELLASRAERRQSQMSDEERAFASRWAGAIDAARACLKKEYPLKERFMARLFGLDVPIPRNRSFHERIVRFAIEFNASESTLYKWREDVFELTIYAAVEAGLLCPFALCKAEESRVDAGTDRC